MSGEPGSGEVPKGIGQPTETPPGIKRLGKVHDSWIALAARRIWQHASAPKPDSNPRAETPAPSPSAPAPRATTTQEPSTS